MKKETEVNSTYSAGYRACCEGYPRTANPFSKIGSMWKNWDMGWEHADEDKPKPPVQNILPSPLIKVGASDQLSM